MIKCCIFDLDGTLFNTLTTIHHYLNVTLRSDGIGEITREQCRLFIGDGARVLIRRSLSANGIEDEERGARLLSEYNRRYNENTLYLTEPYKNIPEMIDELGKMGVTLAVLSNKPDKTVGLIIDEFFSGSFKIARGGREGIPLKPNPDGLNLLIEELGFSPSEVMYVGDTGVDVTTGLRAGVALTVGVSWGFRSVEELADTGAHLIVGDPLEIVREVRARA